MNRHIRQAEGIAFMHARVWLGIGSLALALMLVGPAKAQNFEAALAAAADGIAQAIEQTGKERVAVIDFDQIEGQVTALGRFLAEEISANLAGSPRAFKVIDRANLQSILAEHALSMSGLVNPENAKRLGQIAGVDALVLGTYTDFGESYRLSLKAIATDTAEVVATARTNVPMTNALVQLAARPLDQRELTPSPPSAAEPRPQAPAALPTQESKSGPGILYEAGMEKGGFEKWSLSRSWKRLNGILVSDGTDNHGTAVAPYRPESADYAVEAEIRVTREGRSSGAFGLFVRADGEGAYLTGLGARNELATAICYANRSWDPDDEDDCVARGQSFEAKSEWYKYRAEVKGNSITLLINDSVMSSGIDNKFLSAGRVGLWSRMYQIEVRRFKVTSLEQKAAAPELGDAGGTSDVAGGAAPGTPVEAAAEVSFAARTSPADEVQFAGLPPATGDTPDRELVRAVQQKLQALGFSPGPIDDLWRADRCVRC